MLAPSFNKTFPVALTGVSGYIGRHLSVEMTRRQIPWIAIPKYASPDDMTSLFIQNNIQAVIHLAARTDYIQTPDALPDIVNANILLGCQLLEAMRAAKVSRFVGIGTIWEYYHSSVQRPLNFYAATKCAFKSILAYYSDAYRIDASWLVVSDTYGPDDPRDKIVKILIEAAFNHSPIDLTPGEQVLDLIYIDDLISGILQCLSLPPSRAMTEYLIRSDRRVTLIELVDTLQGLLGRPLPVQFGKRPYREREVFKPYCGGLEVPNWKPKVSLVEGLSLIIQSMRNPS